MVVARPQDGSVLALTAPYGFALPSFAPDNADARVVGHVNAEMRRQLGLNVWTLKCAAQSGSGEHRWRVFNAVARERSPAAPSSAEWLERGRALSAEFAEPLMRDAVIAWFDNYGKPSDDRAPWQSMGWHDEAVNWIRAQLAAQGIDDNAPIVQQRAWGLSCTMLARTGAGDFYFKATPPFMSHEGRIMQAVAERYPKLLPAPLAVDAGRGWLLMPDYGSDMLHECADIARWEDALRLFSRAQVEQATHAQEWLALGCPDRGLGRMVELMDPLIAACCRMLTERDDGLSRDEAQALRALSMPLKMMCARLAQFSVPHSLVHGDLGGNIIIRDSANGEGYIFFDWTDVCVSHPFFEMATISGAYFDESVLKDSPDADIRLRDAYLRAWTAYEPMERLVEAFEASRPLGALHQAMTYMWILTNIPPDARAELEGGLLHWTRSLLRLCGAK